jgi:hypothetical protein
MTAAGEHFRFRFDARYRLLARLFGISDRRSMVSVTDQQLTARFGPWMVRTPLSNVSDVSVTGPYRFLKTAGPAHLSFTDHGLTFATNGDRGVCLEFREPVTGLDPLGLLHHPNLTVTVADCSGLADLLTRRLDDPSERGAHGDQQDRLR